MLTVNPAITMSLRFLGPHPYEMTYTLQMRTVAALIAVALGQHAGMTVSPCAWRAVGPGASYECCCPDHETCGCACCVEGRRKSDPRPTPTLGCLRDREFAVISAGYGGVARLQQTLAAPIVSPFPVTFAAGRARIEVRETGPPPALSGHSTTVLLI